ncbi:tRNA 2-selenouridine(34) synthase MnmH [Halalkalibacter kiskunsagensis]|uniref:tRNA 2-selenouridine(34) synthase MnmH n=1 Tax=Halalkalibacter kiskunsagensis TaxID=1548599 RepID=A0ABV6KBX2_9BACI
MSTVEVKQITLQDVSFEEDIFIDVRSPAEFTEYQIPNAINVPLFSNEERAKVGTAYKQKSKEHAIELGLSMYAPKILAFFKKLKGLQEEMPTKRMVIYCWRGGMRSKTIAGTVGLLGVECYQLVGGIRSFRQYVQKGLEQEALKKRNFIVVAGHTGSRKTEILQVLKRKGYPVIDLEALAGHRGSIFGHIGMKPKSQKQFESLLLEQLQQLENSSYLIIEAESKRIGHIILPDFIIKGKENGVRVELDYPFWSRVEHIYNTYQPEKYKENIYEAIMKMRKYLSSQLLDELDVLQQKEDFKSIFSKLLEEYYDPRYDYAFSKYQTSSIHIEFEDLNSGVGKMIAFIEKYRTKITG